MQMLDYNSGGQTRTRADIALVALPLAAGMVTLVVAGHNLWEEPFGVFTISDAIIQVGGPLVVLGLWAAWGVLAVRRRRRPRFPGIAAVLCWAALNLWIAQVFLVAYFHEPWNQ
jgi:hypothetical protein